MRPTFVFASAFGTLVLASHAQPPSPTAPPLEVVYSTNSSDGRILRLDFATGTSAVVNTDAKLRKRLEGLAVRDDGSAVHLLVSDSKRGEVLFYQDAAGVGQVITTAIPSPESVSLDLAGNAYVLGADGASAGQVWTLPRGGARPGGYAAARLIDGYVPARLEEIRVAPVSAGPLRQGDLLVLSSKPAAMFRYPRVDCAPEDPTCTGFGPREVLLAQAAFPRNTKPAGFALAPNLDLLVTGDQRTILRYRPSGQRVQPDFATGSHIGGSRIVVGVQAGRDYAFVVGGGGEGDDSANSIQRFLVNQDGTGTPDVTVRAGVRNPEGIAMGSAASLPTPSEGRVIVTPAPAVQVAFDDVERAGLTSARTLEFEDNRLARHGAYEVEQKLRDFFPEGSPVRSQLPDVIIPAHVQAFRKGDPLAGTPTFLLAIVNSTAVFSGTVAVDHDEQQHFGYQPSCADADPALQPRMFHAHEAGFEEPQLGEAVFTDVSSDCGVGRGGALSLWLTARDTRDAPEIADEKLSNLGRALEPCIEPATAAALRTAFDAAVAAFAAYEDGGDAAQRSLAIAQLDALIAVAEQDRAAFAACGDSGNVRGELMARALSARFTISGVEIVPSNNAPAFTSSASPSVAENTTAVLTVTATDPDGDTITYSISGGADAALFSIDHATGALTFNAAPDFEAPNDAGANHVYDVVVTASDGTDSPTQSLSVAVTDVNEAPTFTSSSTAGVPENTSEVQSVAASDPEAHAISYSIRGGADAAFFSIDAASGALRFVAPPNFEVRADAGADNVYDVVVSASDGTHAPTQAIAVTVTNVAEAPVFTSAATASVPENTSAVLTVTASDPDADAVSYSISGGADAAFFSIDAASGALRFVAPANFEVRADAGADNVYDVVVAASDGTNAPSQAIAVTVTNVDEAPVFTSGATASVPENTSPATVVLTVTAMDPEGAALTYAISGPDAPFFTIDATSGSLRLRASPDFETRSAYHIVVTAQDGTNAPSQAIVLTVVNVDEAPAFTGPATASVVENSSPATVVLTVTATDPEAAALTYAISGGPDAALFSIDAASGALRFNVAPNFEAPSDAGANNVYDVIVTASDGSNAPSRAIAVTVTNVNEAPVFTGPNSASVQEYLFGPTPVVAITVTATDPDGGAVSYSIGGGLDAAFFSIDPTSGVVTFNAPPDFEAPRSNVYRLNVVASDGFNAPTRLFTVTVTDVNETAVWQGDHDSNWANPQNWENDKAPEPDGPVFFTQNTPFNPTVNSPGFALGSVTLGGAFTGTVHLSQPMTVGGGLSIGSGTTFSTNGNALVVTNLISGGGTLVATGGTVTTGGGLSVTTFQPGISLLFNGSGIWSGTGNFGNVTIMAGVTVTLSSPISASSLAFWNVTGLPNATAQLQGQTLTLSGGLTVSDFGGGVLATLNNPLVVNGATTVGAGSTLRVNASTSFGSSVTVNAAGTLDLRRNTTFNGPLSVGGTLLATTTSIAIRFVSGGLTSFDDGSTLTIAPPASGFVELLATTPGARWQLQLASTATQTFTRVRVQDSDVVGSVNPVASPGTSVNLGGNDLFPGATPGWENLPGLPPAFSSSPAPSVPENTTGVVTVTAIDPDADAVSYSISGGADAALFSINTTSGALRFNVAPNFEAPADAGANNVYDVVVSASDGTNASSQAIAVTVTNVNEAPLFTGPATASVEEYLFGPTPIVAITVTATDPDAGAVSYSIASGLDGALFSIDPTIGVVTFNAPPDFEAPRSNVYRFNVVASDGANAATRLLTVTVTDINETAVWKGSADSSWANPQNWEHSKPPEPDGPVNFTQSANFSPSLNSPGFALGAVTLGGTFTGSVQLSQPVIVGGSLSIGGGTAFSTNGNALVVTGLISGGGTLNAIGGTVTTGGGLTVSTFNPGTSLLFNGSGTWGGPANFGNVTLMGGVTVTLGSAVSTVNLSVNGGAILRAFDALTVDGTTTVGAGSMLDLRSNTTFHGPLSVGGTLRAMSSPITIRFASDGLVSFGDGSSVTMAAPSGFVDLLATTPGTRWQLQLAPGTTQTFTRVRVQDSDVVGSVNAVATAGTIVNLGGNDRFPASTPGWENLPDLAPVFTSSPAASVQENAVAVVTVAASDPDGDPIAYSISGGPDAALFSVDATTGVLRFVAAPNFEAPSDDGGDNVYDVVVSASDGTIAPSQAIEVTVTNVDEAPLFFSPSTVSVAEGMPANTVVLTATAIDPEGSALFYSISGLDAAFFTIDPATGQVRIRTPPDFETKSAYNVQLRANDGTNLTQSFVTIVVTDVPPVFVNSSTVGVPENTPTSTVVMTALAIDPGGGSVTYSIGGLDAAFFTLDSFTGQLRFKTSPDFETKPVYNLQVRAHSGASFTELSVTVFVTDVAGS